MQDSTVTDSTAAAAAAKPVVSNLAQAESLVRKNVYIAAGIGLVPVPVLDLVGLSALQCNLVYRLSKIYGDPTFKHDAVKAVIASLIGSVGSVSIARSLAYSFVKSVPIVGAIAGGVAMPVLGGATTYAIGKVFIQNYESGGTFLTFDPQKVKAYFQKLQQEGKQVVAEVLGTAPAQG